MGKLKGRYLVRCMGNYDAHVWGEREGLMGTYLVRCIGNIAGIILTQCCVIFPFPPTDKVLSVGILQKLAIVSRQFSLYHQSK